MSNWQRVINKIPREMSLEKFTSETSTAVRVPYVIPAPVANSIETKTKLFCNNYKKYLTQSFSE